MKKLLILLSLLSPLNIIADDTITEDTCLPAGYDLPDYIEAACLENAEKQQAIMKIALACAVLGAAGCLSNKYPDSVKPILQKISGTWAAFNALMGIAATLDMDPEVRPLRPLVLTNSLSYALFAATMFGYSVDCNSTLKIAGGTLAAAIAFVHARISYEAAKSKEIVAGRYDIMNLKSILTQKTAMYSGILALMAFQSAAKDFGLGN
jgi:hypothetical protein